MDEDPKKVLEQMRPHLQWNVGADLLFKELQHCLSPDIQKTIKVQIRTEGNQAAVETILNHLTQKDDWLSQLYRALLSPSINRPKLASKLKQSKMEDNIPKEVDQGWSSMGDGDNVPHRAENIQHGAEKKVAKYTWKTKVKTLPPDILSSLKENLDIKDGWKSLAIELGYTSADFSYFESKTGSPTEHLLNNLAQERPDTDLETIFSSLQNMDCKSLLKDLREMCEPRLDSGDAASSNLDKNNPPFSIPDFNPVPDLLPSIDESLKKGEHVSPTISPVMPRKAIISQMDMPKYSESSEQDGDTTPLAMSESESEKKVDPLYMFEVDTSKETAVTESRSSLGPPFSDVSSESLNDSSTSGISKSGQPSETSIYLDCSSSSRPRMADSGFMENADAKNQELIDRTNEIALLLGGTSSDNTVSESTSKSDYTATETAATPTPIKCFEPCEPLSFEQIKMPDPDHDGTCLHEEEKDKIGIEPEMEIDHTGTEMLAESEEKAANMFVENILESALTQHYATIDPSIWSESEIVSSALKVSAEDVEVTEAESLGASQGSALDDDVVILLNSDEMQNDFGVVSQETEPLLPSKVTFSENDTTVTKRDSPVMLSEEEHVDELSEEAVPAKATEILSKPEMKTETTEPVTDLLKLEDEDVSRSENSFDTALLKTTTQDTSEEINEISNQTGENSDSDTSSGGSPDSLPVECLEVSLSESESVSDTELDAKGLMSDETLADIATTAILSKETIGLDTAVSDTNTMEDTINSNLVPETSASEELSEIQSSVPDIVDDSCTVAEFLSEIPSDKSVSNLEELTTSMSVSDVFASKTASDESSTYTKESEGPPRAEESESSVNSAPEVDNSITLPEIKEIPKRELDDSINATGLENSAIQANSVPEVNDLITLPEIKAIPIQELDSSIIAASQPDTELANRVPEVEDLITLPEINEIPIQQLDNSILAAGLKTSAIQPELVHLEPEVKENTVQELQAPESTSQLSLESQMTVDVNIGKIPDTQEGNVEVKEEKESDTKLLAQDVEVILPAKDIESLPLLDESLQQNADEISPEEIIVIPPAKSRFTYHNVGYVVLGMAMVGSGMLMLRRYWK